MCLGGQKRERFMRSTDERSIGSTLFEPWMAPRDSKEQDTYWFTPPHETTYFHPSGPWLEVGKRMVITRMQDHLGQHCVQRSFYRKGTLVINTSTIHPSITRRPIYFQQALSATSSKYVCNLSMPHIKACTSSFWMNGYDDSSSSFA